MQLISRQDALAQGLTRYFTGKSCVQGHVAPRSKDGGCTACRRANVKQWQKANPLKQRAIVRRASAKKLGLPEATRPEPAECECCGRPTVKRGLHRDHDHKTGRFRGWICNSCNGAIGMLGDSLDGLAKASRYLKRTLS